MHIWVEVIRSTAYVHNRTPHQVLGKNTPEEAFSRGKPKFNHLRIFGCPVYIHIPKEKRTKLDPLRRKGIFIRYSDTSKAYRIYFPRFKNIDINRYLTFDEDLTYFRSRRTLIQEVEEPEETRVREMEIGEAIP